MSKISDFEIDSNGCLVRYLGYDEEVIIPNGVKEISECAFMDKRIKMVKFPDTIMYIRKRAFFNNRLTEIDLPSWINLIERDAFWGNKISFITLKNTHDVRIERYAFDENSLEKVRKIGGKGHIVWYDDEVIKNIKILMIPVNHMYLFVYCPNLEELYIDNSNGSNILFNLKKCKLKDKKNLKKIFIKNEISLAEKIMLKTLWSNIEFEFNSEIFQEDTLPKLSYNETSKLQEKINKIYQITALLNEKERYEIESNVTLLLEQYKIDLEKCKPNFEITDESSSSLQPTDVKTLENKLKNSLDAIIFNLATVNSVKKLIEDIIGYKKLMDLELESAPMEAVKTEEQIQYIIFAYQKLASDDIKSQLTKTLNQFQERASKEIMQAFNETSKLSLELDITTEFQKQIAMLYEKTKNFQMKVETYQDLLDSLELKNNSELAIDIRTAKEIINIFYNIDKNRLIEELEKIITNYKNKINEIIANQNVKDIKNATEIELELRKDLHPLLVEIRDLNPQVVSFHKLKEQLSNSLKYLKKESIEPSNGAIMATIKEIEMVLGNEYLDTGTKSKIHCLVSSCLQKWYDELISNEYKILEDTPLSMGTEKLSNHFRFEILILKELSTIKENLENFIQKSMEYKKRTNEALELDNNTSIRNVFFNNMALINKQGALAEEFTLENYRNYLLNQYPPVLEGKMTQGEWKQIIDEDYDDEFLNEVIADTKAFIFWLFETEYEKVNREHSSNGFIEIEIKISDFLEYIENFDDEQVYIHGIHNPVDTLFQPLMLELREYCFVSQHLLATFFEGLEINIITPPRVYPNSHIEISGPKEIFDALYENNCSVQALRRKKIELGQEN